MDAPVLTQDYMPTRHMRTAHANHVEGQCADAITCIDTVHVMRVCVVGSTSAEACFMHMHIYAYTYIYAYTSPGHTCRRRPKCKRWCEAVTHGRSCTCSRCSHSAGSPRGTTEQCGSCVHTCCVVHDIVGSTAPAGTSGSRVSGRRTGSAVTDVDKCAEMGR